MNIDIGATLERLTHLQRQMGASEEPELPAALLNALRTDGVSITIGEIPAAGEGVLRWRGQVIVLYIRDQHAWRGQAGGYRFHVAECSTFQSMRDQGRESRYVVTNRSDGRFPVRTGSYGPPALLSMSVCKNCLSRLDWDGYRRAGNSGRDKIVAAFDIVAFFSTYQDARKPIWLAPKAEGVPAPAAIKPTRMPDKPATKALPPVPPHAVVTPAAPGPEQEWAFSITDAQFRQVALHLQLHGSISESEIHEMVEGARRARRFGLSLDEWFGGAPFRVEVRSALGVKSYHRVPR